MMDDALRRSEAAQRLNSSILEAKNKKLEAENTALRSQIEGLREALIQIDALDPEDPYRFVFMDEAALRHLVMGMGETARRALAALEPDKEGG